MKDLVVLGADKKIEATLEGLLNRPRALGIRPIEFEIKVHPQRDPGCYRQAAAFLQPLRSSFDHALVVFDRAWEGAPFREADLLAMEVERGLAITWERNAGVVVIDPELEAWVWSDSPHVQELLGWRDRTPALREWLGCQGLWEGRDPKPGDPKTAVERVVRETRMRWTAAVCRRLADSVSVDRCSDRSFGHFRELLSRWFTASD